RAVAAVAELEEIATLSDVAVMKRLQAAAPWLERLLGAILAERVPQRLTGLGRSLRLIDGTTLSAPGGGRPDWRLHVSFDLVGRRIDELTLTPARQGESLSRLTLRAGDLILADRGFVRPNDLRAVVDAGGDFLNRLGSRQLRLLTPKRKPFDIRQA